MIIGKMPVEGEPAWSATMFWSSLGGITALGALQFGVMKWIASLAGRLTTAEIQASGAQAIAGGALAKVEMIGTEFHNNRVETERRIERVSANVDNAAQSIINAEGRLTKSIDDFREQMKEVVNRLDRLLEQPYRNAAISHPRASS